MGVGSAGEEIATTDLMKEVDMLTINSNAVRQAASARNQSTNYSMTSSVYGFLNANAINPLWSGINSLIMTGTPVASSWYSRR